MPVHAFVDESKKNGLLIVASIVPVEHVQATRKVMNGLLLKNQRRIHFKHEHDRRKKQIVAEIARLPITIRLYHASLDRGELEARRSCLTRLAVDLRSLDATLLVVERDDSLVEHDRRWLFESIRRAGDEMDYLHLRAHEESLLWIADALAWCWPAGGMWRDRVRTLVRAENRL